MLHLIIISSCTAQPQDSTLTTSAPVTVVNKVGEIPPPKGFYRIEQDSLSIGQYLQNLSLKEDNNVYLYNGELKYNQDAQYAVIDIDFGNRDLQQCADATMRLRAEHLYATGQKDQIQFHFTSGHLASWSVYAKGYRPKILGSDVKWVKTASYDSSYTCFRKYMDLVFSYCGTRSMDKEVEPISIHDIRPGDVFHQTGNPYGHAVTVMDVVQDTTGAIRFLLSQSYMPAQSIHILVNPNDSKMSPWYALEPNQSLTTPEWDFPVNSLKRWKD